MAIMSRQNNTKRLIKDLIWFVSDGAIEKSAPEFPNGNRRENIKKPAQKARCQRAEIQLGNKGVYVSIINRLRNLSLRQSKQTFIAVKKGIERKRKDCISQTIRFCEPSCPAPRPDRDGSLLQHAPWQPDTLPSYRGMRRRNGLRGHCSRVFTFSGRIPFFRRPCLTFFIVLR